MIILTGKKRKMGQARKKTSETEKSTGKKEKPTNATQQSNFFKAVFLYPPEKVMVNSLLKFRYFNHPHEAYSGFPLAQINRLVKLNIV
jgi:hypothetical protein